jgi:hypothetical protein
VEGLGGGRGAVKRETLYSLCLWPWCVEHKTGAERATTARAAQTAKQLCNQARWSRYWRSHIGGAILAEPYWRSHIGGAIGGGDPLSI